MHLVWQILIGILLVLSACLIGIKIYLTLIKGVCKSTIDLTGKVALITGANTGKVYMYIYSMSLTLNCHKTTSFIIQFLLHFVLK